MKLVIVALCLVAVALAAPVDPEPIKILRSEFEQQPEGGFVYNYETENGISQSATGELKQVPDEDNKPRDVVVFRGSYSYTNPEGQLITITYVADENGFQPEGDSIPKPARR